MAMAIVSIFALIVLFAIFFVQTSTRKKRKAGKHVKLATPEELARYLWIIGGLIIFGFSVSFSMATSPSFCLSCHGNSRVARDLKSSVHRKLACQDCHQTPGFLGSVSYRLEVGRMVIGWFMGRTEKAAGSSSRDACLACHRDSIKKTIISKSIRMEHKEPISNGYRCEQCHFGLAHDEAGRWNAMSVCYDCHGKDKPLKCEACHVGWAGASNYPLKDYAKVALLGELECERCHDPEKDCTSCHKIAMPHSEEWKAGGHALKAGSDANQCWTCHKLGSCVKCHPGMPGPHAQVKGWIKLHGVSSREPKANCAGCHKQKECLACHADTLSYRLRVLPDR